MLIRVEMIYSHIYRPSDYHSVQLFGTTYPCSGSRNTFPSVQLFCDASLKHLHKHLHFEQISYSDLFIAMFPCILL